jgi:D-glycero-alpha-D-manno-heptose-7-phosphate kinase
MIISRTPLRISFSGGGTDLPDYYRAQGRFGAVVSTAINWYIYITANKKWDDQIRVSYSKTEIVNRVDELEHNIIREALKIVGIEKGIDIVYMADLPLTTAGSGLGSSSSLAVGVLNALYAYVGKHVSAERLAREACQIEIELLQHPMGKQDQYIAAYGGLNYIQFNSDDSVFVNPIVCTQSTKRALNSKLMLFYTGTNRISSHILAEQKASIAERIELHHKLVELAVTTRERLCENDVSALGPLLHQGWMYKTQLSSKITNNEIDDWYRAALDSGAKGGKIAGAGGGGFLLLYCDEDKQERVRKALAHLRYCPFELEPQGSKIIYVAD